MIASHLIVKISNFTYLINNEGIIQIEEFCSKPVLFIAFYAIWIIKSANILILRIVSHSHELFLQMDSHFKLSINFILISSMEIFTLDDCAHSKGVGKFRISQGCFT